MQPVKIDYARPQPKPAISTAQKIGYVLLSVVSGVIVLLDSLMLLLAFTFHTSDPADPKKVAVSVVLDLVFLWLGLWSFLKQRR